MAQQKYTSPIEVRFSTPKSKDSPESIDYICKKSDADFYREAYQYKVETLDKERSIVIIPGDEYDNCDLNDGTTREQLKKRFYAAKKLVGEVFPELKNRDFDIGSWMEISGCIEIDKLTGEYKKHPETIVKILSEQHLPYLSFGGDVNFKRWKDNWISSSKNLDKVQYVDIPTNSYLNYQTSSNPRDYLMPSPQAQSPQTQPLPAQKQVTDPNPPSGYTSNSM